MKKIEILMIIAIITMIASAIATITNAKCQDILLYAVFILIVAVGTWAQIGEVKKFMRYGK